MVQASPNSHLLYPDSDGKPMADNTMQYRWIVRLVGNLKRLLKDQIAFVAGDLLWYPVQVDQGTVPSQAPDAMVVLGRPDGDRGSYQQWKEENIAPQVVFEIISPSNSAAEMADKQLFYQQYGVMEMYFYDPKSYNFWGLVREAHTQNFSLITALNIPWTSPLLQIRFELFDDGLAVFYPDGQPFRDFEELAENLDQAQSELNQAQAELTQAQAERERAFAKLRELGIDPTTL
ncbi:MAG: Uma2 family endonuclease [Cyanothece sp. SIO2G6]|nr:Uma2 family endonuclease [Cyanothece sp. SIO2G6]